MKDTVRYFAHGIAVWLLTKLVAFWVAVFWYILTRP